MADRYLIQNPQVAWRVYDGEAVIISPDDSTLNTLNAVGTLIWEGADGKTSVSAIVNQICEKFDVEAEQAEQDSAVFIEKLCQRGLLLVSEARQGET